MESKIQQRCKLVSKDMLTIHGTRRPVSKALLTFFDAMGA
jgi:hypothetical protein